MNDSGTESRRNVLFVVAGPSGAGKKAVLDGVRTENSRLVYSVSATTRSPRVGEVEGREYYFMTPDEFRTTARSGGFIEYAEVHGEMYGTLESELDRLLASGMDVILEIDVQGADAVRKKYPEAVLVFVVPPRFEVLRERLASRGSENAESLERRLETARNELCQKDKFDYIVVNDKLDDAVAQMQKIIRDKRCRSDRQKQKVCKGETKG